MAKNGRPLGGSAYSQDVITAITKARKLADVGYLDGAIAEYLGVSKTTVKRWKEEHPEFGELLKRLRDKTIADGAAALKKSACGHWVWETKAFVIENQIRTIKIKKYYNPNPISIQYLLGNLDPEHWRHRRDEQEAADEPIIPVAVNIVAQSARVEKAEAGDADAQEAES
jgi:hypothetical protein